MIYVVNSGDTLMGIATRFSTTIRAIMEANVICNPNLVFPGQPLIIPEPGINLPKAGGYPYYVVNYGDTLWCLSNQFSQTIRSLAAANQISDPNRLFAAQELLVRFEPPNTVQLFNEWNRMGGVSCEELNSLQIHGIYYIGTFQWETLGESAVPYLVSLLGHSCATVRFYTVLSLGRIGKGEGTRLALRQAQNDQDTSIAELARIGLQRYQLIGAWSKRIHLTTQDTILHQLPNLTATGIPVPKGTPVIALRWNIPSPTGEEGPRGDIQIYDYVQLTATGESGYIPRVGFNEILMI
jgi:LysM repeat protein